MKDAGRHTVQVGVTEMRSNAPRSVRAEADRQPV